MSTPASPCRILILGAGFGGLTAAQTLGHLFKNKKLSQEHPIEVTLVNQDNFFVFTPMLPEAAGGTLEFRHITYPIRQALQRLPVIFRRERVLEINLDAKQVTTLNEGKDTLAVLPYDILILGLGSVPNSYNLPGVSEYTFPLKDVSDAIALRNQVIDQFEQSVLESDEQRRRELLTFLVAGGGDAGVETVMELRDLIHGALLKDYPMIKPDEISLKLVAFELLPHVEPNLAQYATEQMRRKGIEIMDKTMISEVNPRWVQIKDGPRIPTQTCVWTAGVKVHPAITKLDCPKDRTGRLLVDTCSELDGYPNVFALGDCAAQLDTKTEKPHPQTAQVAVRQAQNLARNVVARLKGEPLQPFDFTTLLHIVPLGYQDGVANILGVRFSGFPAWVVWRSLYLFLLPDWDNRLRVSLDWTIALFFRKDTSQIKETRSQAAVQRSPEHALLKD
ncbi:NAD(P)/FAD-dependent oxidoreductase [Leptolyngbya sp. FACHB-261]|uniref:NAD(P)/FAD-dependent oxidoreductase n=1 Tax=Leptolyngbya sp. FACHB-261 TaxID=2692806 RepID=UPI001686C82D|nr:NAD(P)/FAD-dependent oxidoreductase [Leptolyngbya sp. FACHB-261]MBD2103691.1 NAD(P)/FAD-dependent oxidoreductase [Leptolyngbya sp. FACHB-261]